MIYKVPFHISTLYIYQISSTQEISTLQDMQERKKKTCYMISFDTQETSHMKWKAKILHNGEYQ